MSRSSVTHATAVLPTPALPAYSHAFQPIVDATTGTVYSHEALLHGPHNESAAATFAQVPAELAHQFDQEIRASAVRLAARLGLDCQLNVNLLPSSLLHSADALGTTLAALAASHLPVDRIILEITEGEMIQDPVAFAHQLGACRGMGMQIAIDDFGAGYAGLNLLADFQPDLIKLDMQLVRHIESRGPRQAIVRAIAQACRDLGIEIIAEGVETQAEYAWFREEGIQLFQGHYLARPAFAALITGPFPT